MYIKRNFNEQSHGHSRALYAEGCVLVNGFIDNMNIERPSDVICIKIRVKNIN